jgi:hypothetical protein
MFGAERRKPHPKERHRGEQQSSHTCTSLTVAGATVAKAMPACVCAPMHALTPVGCRLLAVARPAP